MADSEDLCAGYNDTVDSDGDGIPDDCDSTPLPEEENQTNGTDILPEDGGSSDAAADSGSTDSNMTYAVIAAIVGLVIVLIAAIRLFFIRPEENSAWDSPPIDTFSSPVPEHYPPEQTQPVADLAQMEVAVQGPPLPAGGLPEGWTMEQWQHYGHQYQDQFGEQ